MKRFLVVFAVAACSSGKSSSAIDAPDVGFDKPTMAIHANTQGSDGTWTDVGLADLSCLGSASDDQATTVAVALSTVVLDFQNQTPVSGITTTAFAGLDYGSAFDTETSDGSGDVTVTIPIGTTRFGFEMTGGEQFPTLLLNQKVDPGTATQTLAKIQSVSTTTANTLPPLIGQTRAPNSGVVAGAVRDCQAREMSHFVVTVSSTPTTATPIAGAEAYYFSLAPELPVLHNVLDSANQDALFMAIQLSATPVAYVQAWGYTTDAAAQAGGDMTLVSQLQVPILANTVITGSFEPLRQ